MPNKNIEIKYDGQSLAGVIDVYHWFLNAVNILQLSNEKIVQKYSIETNGIYTDDIKTIDELKNNLYGIEKYKITNFRFFIMQDSEFLIGMFVYSYGCSNNTINIDAIDKKTLYDFEQALMACYNTQNNSTNGVNLKTESLKCESEITSIKNAMASNGSVAINGSDNQVTINYGKSPTKKENKLFKWIKETTNAILANLIANWIGYLLSVIFGYILGVAIK